MKLYFGLVAVSMALLGSVGIVSAADMPVKARPPVIPTWDWSGFYVGLNGGYGQNDSTGDRTCINPAGAFFGAGCTPNIVGHVFTPSGALFGGTAGYNIQAGSFLYGVETDIQWSDIKASATVPIGLAAAPSGVYIASDDLRWFGTLRGRIGFLPAPQLLIYATGGLIYGNENVAATTSFSPTFGYPSAASSTRAGGVVGVGAEYAFTHDFSAKVEGLFYDMGTISPSFLCPAGATTCTAGFNEGGSFDAKGFIVRGGLNWHFNLAGPIQARY
jgi:outer membrane immunogenic protein